MPIPGLQAHGTGCGRVSLSYDVMMIKVDRDNMNKLVPHRVVAI